MALCPSFHFLLDLVSSALANWPVLNRNKLVNGESATIFDNRMPTANFALISSMFLEYKNVLGICVSTASMDVYLRVMKNLPNKGVSVALKFNTG